MARATTRTFSAEMLVVTAENFSVTVEKVRKELGFPSLARNGIILTIVRKTPTHMMGVNLSDRVAPAARLQNRTCTFRRIRLLNCLAVVISIFGKVWEMCFESLNICRKSKIFHPYIGTTTVFKACSL